MYPKATWACTLDFPSTLGSDIVAAVFTQSKISQNNRAVVQKSMLGIAWSIAKCRLPLAPILHPNPDDFTEFWYPKTNLKQIRFGNATLSSKVHRNCLQTGVKWGESKWGICSGSHFNPLRQASYPEKPLPWSSRP